MTGLKDIKINGRAFDETSGELLKNVRHYPTADANVVELVLTNNDYIRIIDMLEFYKVINGSSNIHAITNIPFEAKTNKGITIEAKSSIILFNDGKNHASMSLSLKDINFDHYESELQIKISRMLEQHYNMNAHRTPHVLLSYKKYVELVTHLQVDSIEKYEGAPIIISLEVPEDLVAIAMTP